MPQQDLTRLWEEHTKHEFVTRDTESTLATMVEDAYVNHVPVMTSLRPPRFSGFGRHDLAIGLGSAVGATPTGILKMDPARDELIDTNAQVQPVTKQNH